MPRPRTDPATPRHPGSRPQHRLDARISPVQPGRGTVRRAIRPPDPPPTRLDQPRMPRSTGAQPPTRPAPPRSAALSGCHQPPIGAQISPDWPPPRPRGRFADRPAGCRVAHRRSPRLWPSAQGPPAPHPATPAQFPPAHQARGPIATHTIDGFSDFGFWVLDWILELKNWAGAHRSGSQGQAAAVRDPRLSGESGDGIRQRRADWEQRMSACSDGTPGESDGLRFGAPTGSDHC